MPPPPRRRRRPPLYGHPQATPPPATLPRLSSHACCADHASLDRGALAGPDTAALTARGGRSPSRSHSAPPRARSAGRATARSERCHGRPVLPDGEDATLPTLSTFVSEDLCSEG